jgi:Flp pilus assembly secretin CpaC
MYASNFSRFSGSTGTLAAFLAGATLIVAMSMATAPVRASDLIVKYDQSQLLRLPRPVAEIIIGNPTIADVTVQSSSLLVITGKSFGITNIIALDAERNVISDQRVLVQRDERKTVNLQKGTQRESYNCSPQCNPTITVGDANEYFAAIAKTSTQKLKMSEGQAGSGGTAAR